MTNHLKSDTPERMGDAELLPCPFCGGEASFDAGSGEVSLDAVECNDCGARVQDDHATRAWNRRAALAPGGVTREELKALADDLRTEEQHAIDEHRVADHEALHSVRLKLDAILGRLQSAREGEEERLREALKVLEEIGQSERTAASNAVMVKVTQARDHLKAALAAHQAQPQAREEYHGG